MDSEDVSRETSLRSVCGEILHPAARKNFTLALAPTTEYRVPAQSLGRPRNLSGPFASGGKEVVEERKTNIFTETS